MPLDPNIPFGAVPKFNTPFQVLGQLGELQAQQQDRELRKQQIASQQAQEDLRRRQLAKDEQNEADQIALTQLIASNPTASQDDMKVLVAQKVPRMYGSYLKQLDDHQKEAADIATKVTTAITAAQKWIQKDAEDVLAAPEAARLGVYNSNLQTQEKLFPFLAPHFQQIRQRLASGEDVTALLQAQVPKKEKEEGAFTLGPGQQRFDASGKPVASVPEKAAPEPASLDTAILAASRAKDSQEVRRLLNLKGQIAAAGREPAGQNEPLVPVIGSDGEPVLVPRSQAIGKRPASTREQGRKMTSGDANKIADIDTSLKDLDTLATTLAETKNATGTRAQAGAMLPNFVTDFTGWGTDPKKRQGVIDRVKQVIGKALEGGVLRKEDEIKYGKILPTIGDPQAVAASKLEGLRKALEQKRSTVLDDLSDAGFDSSRFVQRGAPGGKSAKPKSDPLGLFD